MGWVFCERVLMWLSLEWFQGGCQFLLRGDVVLGGVGCGVSLSVILIWRSSFVAQLFGHRHAGWNVKQGLSLSCIISSFGVLVCLLILVGLLVGAVSRYCHFWYRVFDITTLANPCSVWVLVITLQYHDTVNFVQNFDTEDPHWLLLCFVVVFKEGWVVVVVHGGLNWPCCWRGPGALVL